MAILAFMNRQTKRAPQKAAGPVTAERHVWRVAIDDEGSAARHMARDAALAQRAGLSVRMFLWSRPAVSLGLKQPQPAWLDPVVWDNAGVEAVERPTGGAIAFHGSDVSVGLVVPRHFQLPVHVMLAAACRCAVRLCGSYGVEAASWTEHAAAAGRTTYCLTQTNPYAVMAGDRKLAGFALRRYPESWLIQGSLLVRSIPDRLAGLLPAEVLEEMSRKAVPLAEAAGRRLSEAAVAQRWSDQWSDWWEEAVVAELAGRVAAPRPASHEIGAGEP